MGATHHNPDPDPSAPLTGSHDHQHEHRDIQIKGIVIFAVVLALITIGIELFLGVWLGYYSREEQQIATELPARLADTAGQFPSPRLQGNPGFDMKGFAAQEKKVLESYAPAVSATQAARLPIDRAMKIIADTGLPVRDEQTPPTPSSP